MKKYKVLEFEGRKTQKRAELWVLTINISS